MTTIVRASCHCGLNTFNTHFKDEDLPIFNDLCHCNTCRHSTGQLMGNWVNFEGDPRTVENEPADLSNLTGYTASETATRWFCSRCSCHILWQTHKPRTRWCIAAGTLERTQGIVQPSYHHWISSTLDGGISKYIQTVGNVTLKRYLNHGEEGAEQVPTQWRDDPRLSLAQTRNHLLAYCACGTIKLAVSRPSEASAAISSPYPDLMYNNYTELQSKIANVEDRKWWLRPLNSKNPTKYLAGHCACNSCRLCCGFEIQSWAFIPRVNFTNVAADPHAPLNLRDANKRPAGLKQYKSNVGRTREFCGTCGATVFWWGDERPDLLDLSVGLVDQEQVGSRAEDWLEWQKERVSFKEDAMSTDLVQALAHGLRNTA